MTADVTTHRCNSKCLVRKPIPAKNRSIKAELSLKGLKLRLHDDEFDFHAQKRQKQNIHENVF